MPVLRRREHIPINQLRQITGAGSPVTRYSTGINVSTGAVRAANELSATIASDTARAMSIESEEKAKAYARAAVFSMDESGMPQMPPNVTEDMGRIAATTYDSAMQERFAHQMTTAMRAQINDAQIANQYDIDAFLADANTRLERMAENVPEGFEGMFQQISQGLMVDAGASVGYRQANLHRQEAIAAMPQSVEDMQQNIESAVIMGDIEGAQVAFEAAVDWINAQPITIWDDAKKRNALEKMTKRTGWQLLVHNDYGNGRKLEDLPMDELMALNAKFLTPNPEEDADLWNYFIVPGDKSPNYSDIGNFVTGMLGRYQQGANQLQQERDRQAKLDGTVTIMLQGGSSGGALEKVAMNTVLAENLLLTDENGKPVPITLAQWPGILADPKRRAQTVSLVKQVGHGDNTLEQYLRSLDRSQSAASLAPAFTFIRDLAEQENPHGVVVDYMGMLPDSTQEIYSLADALHGDGDWKSYDYSVAKAMEIATDYRENPDQWDNTHRARIINRHGLEHTSDRVTPENVEQRWRDEVIEVAFDGAIPTEKEIDRALLLSDVHLRNQLNPEEALRIVKQQVSTGYVDSEMMGGMRSSLSPEKWYAEPEWLNASDVWEGVKSKVSSKVLGSLETLFGAKRIGLEVNFGSAAAGATQFQLLANEKIAAAVGELHPSIRDAYLKKDYLGGIQKDAFYEGGPDGDYYLRPVGDDTPPTYYVYMAGANNLVKTPLPGPDGRPFILDLREEYETIRQVGVMTDRILKITDERALDFAIHNSSMDGLDPNKPWTFAQAIEEFYKLEKARGAK